MEIQILDDYGREPDVHSNGALYAAVKPAVNPSKPAGQWNSREIVCIGRRIKVSENGKRLYAVNLDDPAYNSGPDAPNLGRRLPAGFIGLQNHGSPVEFRNIRIKDMSPQ